MPLTHSINLLNYLRQTSSAVSNEIIILLQLGEGVLGKRKPSSSTRKSPVNQPTQLRAKCFSIFTRVSYASSVSHGLDVRLSHPVSYTHLTLPTNREV